MIEYSGGSPRELLRLLHYAFLRASGDRFDANAVQAALQDAERLRIPEVGQIEGWLQHMGLSCA